MFGKYSLVVLLCLDIFQDIERLYPSRGAQLSNNKVSFGIENKKLIRKLLVLGADPSFLLRKNVYSSVFRISCFVADVIHTAVEADSNHFLDSGTVDVFT